jgi:hypothetical protein
VPDAPLTFWLVDRSRYKLGTGRCPQARYLNYHAGPTGYGLTAQGESLPLATGSYVHLGSQGFCDILQKDDRLPELDETRAIIEDVRREYVALCEAKGYLGILAGEHTAETITEQSALISGLLWMLRLKILPWLHSQYRVLSVETERPHFLSCTCGAGPAPYQWHLERNCQGKILMLRNDILGLRRGGTTLAYFEIKTTGWESDAWAEQWESDPQLGLGTLDVDKLLGAEVTELYIIGLNKGPRRRDKDDPMGRRKQMSSLCFGYKRPGNPPFVNDDWLPAYEWINENGEVKRASRAHKRTGIWELNASDWVTWQSYRSHDPSLSAEEFWARNLPESVKDRVGFVLGPMNRQDHQIASVRVSMLGEEERWQEILWQLYEAQQTMAWSSPEFQTLMDRLVPKSWQCRPFGKDHQCQFYGICHRQPGWEDPIGSGKFKPRLPHHELEMEQAVARGLLVPEAAEDEGEVDG